MCKNVRTLLKWYKEVSGIYREGVRKELVLGGKDQSSLPGGGGFGVQPRRMAETQTSQIGQVK